MFCLFIYLHLQVIIVIILNRIYEYRGFLWLTIDPYLLSLLVSPLDGIQCLYRTDESMFLLVGQIWCVHV